MNAEEVTFTSQGVECRGWHYRPAGTELAPAVVMGHGFAATYECGLASYAQAFAEAGMHAFAFDYRHFGASQGEPRQLVNIPGQHADWEAAVACIRQRPGVDGSRVAAWGTSFGGGHSLVAAARIPHLVAAVCQCPMMDGRAAFRAALQQNGIWMSLRILGVAVSDFIRGLANASPVRMPVAALPGQAAAMSTPDALSGYRGICPDTWENSVCARVALSLSGYRPITYAKQVRVPVLLLICDNDTVAPASAAAEVGRQLGELAEVHHYPLGHFDIYQGEAQQVALRTTVDFLRRHLFSQAT